MPSLIKTKSTANGYPKDVTKIINLSKELSLESLTTLAKALTDSAHLNQEKQRVASAIVTANLPPDAVIVKSFKVLEVGGEHPASSIEAIFGIIIPVKAKGVIPEGLHDADQGAAGEKEKPRYAVRSRTQRVLDGQAPAETVTAKPEVAYTDFELSYSRTPDQVGTYTLAAKYGGLVASDKLVGGHRKFGSDFRSLLVHVGRDIGLAGAATPADEVLRLVIPEDCVWRDVTLSEVDGEQDVNVKNVNDGMGNLKM
ncbi:hypothetical protein RQP46_007182 [Phenoliferia psychrophenolica]